MKVQHLQSHLTISLPCTKVQHLQGHLTISLPCTTVTTDGAETHFMQLLSVTFQISDSKLENEMQRSQRNTESRL